MGILCSLRPHKWGEWSNWERTEELRVQGVEKVDFPSEPEIKRIPKGYRYMCARERERFCKRCSKRDVQYETVTGDKWWEYGDEEEVDWKGIEGRIDPSSPYVDVTSRLGPSWVSVNAAEVHSRPELVELVDRNWMSKGTEIPPENLQESLEAHKSAKKRPAPVEIGEYVTGGVEDISTHHSEGNTPLIRHEGYVIFVKKALSNLSLGDVISAKVTSFNSGDSANALFVQTEDGSQ